MDLTPRVPEGRQLVQAYRPGGFTISGRDFAGSVLVVPGRTVPWPVAALDQLTVDSLGPILEVAAEVELLVLGCGRRFAPVPAALRQELRERHGMVVEAMDTAAACRTYNVLLAEERRVAAALIAVA